ncbi:MAG: TlpA family protein disulfide reductase [Myxococcales bacterium]|nr:TlpA family protein disulfide reductase [Myxococcales bacterium]
MSVGRASLCAALLMLAQCEETTSTAQGSAAVRERSQAITGSTSLVGPGSAPSTTLPPRVKSARKLCLDGPERRHPEGRIEVVSAIGAATLPTPIAFGAGKWLWLNLWAAWCGPCKEEMPRLMSWRRALEKDGVRVTLAFVSLDDDEREMRRFLSSQPETGVRATYWLREGKREDWLTPLGLTVAPRLPVHALVSPRGDVACVIDGALEEADFPQFKALFKPAG